MNVIFCLNLRKQYKNINDNLLEIINTYDEIIYEINDNTEVDKYDILMNQYLNIITYNYL